MVWSDAHFEAWPLGERAVAESLHAWSCKGRKLVVLAKNYDYVRRQHARFVAWRSTWDHLLECRTCPAEDEEGFVSALWSPLWAMRRLDLVRCTGYAGYEAQRRVALKEILDEYKRQSSPGFAATTLGL